MSRISIAVMGLSSEKSHGLAGNYQLRNYIDEERRPRQNKLSEKFSITILGAGYRATGTRRGLRTTTWSGINL